jgi:hypothetical protein
MEKREAERTGSLFQGILSPPNPWWGKTWAGQARVIDSYSAHIFKLALNCF